MERMLLGKPVASLLDDNSKLVIDKYLELNKKQPTLTAITVGNNLSLIHI